MKKGLALLREEGSDSSLSQANKTTDWLKYIFVHRPVIYKDVYRKGRRAGKGKWGGRDLFGGALYLN